MALAGLWSIRARAASAATSRLTACCTGEEGSACCKWAVVVLASSEKNEGYCVLHVGRGCSTTEQWKRISVVEGGFLPVCSLRGVIPFACSGPTGAATCVHATRARQSSCLAPTRALSAARRSLRSSEHTPPLPGSDRLVASCDVHTADLQHSAPRHATSPARWCGS